LFLASSRLNSLFSCPVHRHGILPPLFLLGFARLILLLCDSSVLMLPTALGVSGHSGAELLPIIGTAQRTRRCCAARKRAVPRYLCESEAILGSKWLQPFDVAWIVHVASWQGKSWRNLKGERESPNLRPTTSALHFLLHV
jgi:hypothetical protein